MEPNPQTSPTSAGWTYTQITICDGDRTLKPTHICGDEITFRDPPKLVSREITIRIRNGDRQTIRTATVLPHEPGSLRIPVQLVEQKAPAKLTA